MIYVIHFAAWSAGLLISVPTVPARVERSRLQGQTDLEDFGKRGVMALRASQRLREMVAVAGVHSSTPTFVEASGLCVAISKTPEVQTVDLG